MHRKPAGVTTDFLFIEDIGLGDRGEFTDLQDQIISNMFKLYPWNLCWGDFLHQTDRRRCSLAGTGLEEHYSNKALLPMLWEMFPDHPEPAAGLFCG